MAVEINSLEHEILLGDDMDFSAVEPKNRQWEFHRRQWGITVKPSRRPKNWQWT
jgi:hypothetical protein